jgi:hypothetical protein
MKVGWNENVVSVNFADEGHDETLTLDLDGLMQNVLDAGLRFGFQTKIRNFRAQVATDTREGAEAFKRMKAGIALLDSGVWASEKQAASKWELTDDEKRGIVQAVIVESYKKPDETAERCIERFMGAPKETQEAILTALKPVVDKRMKDTIRARKIASKTVMPTL